MAILDAPKFVDELPGRQIIEQDRVDSITRLIALVLADTLGRWGAVAADKSKSSVENLKAMIRAGRFGDLGKSLESAIRLDKATGEHVLYVRRRSVDPTPPAAPEPPTPAQATQPPIATGIRSRAAHTLPAQPEPVETTPLTELAPRMTDAPPVPVWPAVDAATVVPSRADLPANVTCTCGHTGRRHLDNVGPCLAKFAGKACVCAELTRQ